MASTMRSSTPACFNFLKEGLLLPSRNWSLFAAVFALLVASTSLLLLGNDLAVLPLADDIRADIKALNGTTPMSSDYMDIVKDIQKDTREMMITTAVYLLFAFIVSSAVRLVVLFAAVSTYSGEGHTAGSLLAKARGQLKGPVLTLAFVYVVEIAYIAVMAALAALISYLAMKKSFLVVLVLSLFVIVGSVYLVYFSFVCSFAVVVSVAEPGCSGAGAVARAWRMVKGKTWRVVLFVVVTVVLAAVLTPVHTYATTWAHTSAVAGLLLGLVYVVLAEAVALFAACAIVAFYFECKESSDMFPIDYAKVSGEEANA